MMPPAFNVEHWWRPPDGRRARWKKRRPAGRAAGYTLLEISVVLTVLSAVALMWLHQAQQEAARLRVVRTAEEMRQILEAGMLYHLRHSRDSLIWPDNVAELASGGYLPHHPISPYGTEYQLPQATGGPAMQVMVETHSPGEAEAIASMLPMSFTSGTEVGSSVVRPGMEIVNSMFYLLDGTRPLQGDMDVGGNSLRNLDEISARSFLFVSDRLLKRDIQPLTGDWRKQLLALQPVQFRWRQDGAPGLGLVAQQVQQVAPELVRQQGQALHIDHGALLTLLLASLQAQEQQLLDMQARLGNGG